MHSMSAVLLFLAAAAAAPTSASDGGGRPDVGASATATVSVRIVSGARIAMSEVQDDELPAIQASSIRAEDGNLRPARLVEFN